MKTAYLIDAVRTPVGRRNGQLSAVRPDDLLVHALQALMKRNPDLPSIEDVIVGCAMPEAEQGLNVARMATLLAGMPVATTGYTVNRFCASGLQAVANAASMIQTGAADAVIAAGTESMSQVPMMGHRPAINPRVFNDDNVAIAYGMGVTAEKVAQRFKVDAEAQNAFALGSHNKAIEAQKNGCFKDEIAPLEVRVRSFDSDQDRTVVNARTVAIDEGPRADTSLEKLQKLRPAFDQKGTVTAGNSSQMSDGAAAVLLASEKAVKQCKLKPLMRFVSYAVAGVPPEIMGIGPVEAVPKALQQAGLSLSDMDWIELNEAFAAQALAVIGALRMDESKVNPQGGAIALGHPLGATGAIRTATLMSAFRRNAALRYGMITMCVGTGMGAAAVFENLCDKRDSR